MELVRKLISWLTFHPTTDEIARALATDYLAEFSAKGVRFSRLQNDDSIIIFGEYGFEDSSLWSDRVIPSSEWRARDTGFRRANHKRNGATARRFMSKPSAIAELLRGT
jgi:hypothetical protein